MTTTSKVVLFGGGALLLWYLYKIRALANLQFIARSVGYNNGMLQLGLGVQNPTNTDLTVNSIFGQVLVNGYPVGNVSSNQVQPQLVKNNSESIVQIGINPDMFGTLGLLINQINNGTPADQHVELKATANVQGTLVPIDVQFT